MRGRRWGALVVSGCVALAACGGSSNETADDTTVAETSVLLDADPDRAVSSLEEVKSAVVRLVGTGSFADPAGGMQANVPGTGSGFIVHPSGVVVTNNHVVTGSAKLEAFVEGEEEPRLARVLGVSECSDLAVVQLLPNPGDEDGDLPYLAWRTDSVDVGMQIYAAGFPLGDAEYTLLDGVLSKESAQGDFSWASVQSVVEHSADTLPGSSGGPIVDEDGRVIAVNFAGNEVGQSFGVGGDVARPIVEQLAGGTDVESIGINGEALFGADTNGLFVYSVHSGSLADVAGVRAGDVVLTMESISLGVDGTMGDYCDVLRSHTPTDTVAIEIYRPGDDAIYAGQINGRELARVDGADGEVAEPPPSEPPPYEFVAQTDESGSIAVRTPETWTVVDRNLYDLNAVFGVDAVVPHLRVTTDADLWNTDLEASGVVIVALPPGIWTPDELSNELAPVVDCDSVERDSYDDGVYTGVVERRDGCGAGATVYEIVAEPADRSLLAFIQLVLLDGEHPGVFDEVVASWQVSSAPEPSPTAPPATDPPPTAPPSTEPPPPAPPATAPPDVGPPPFDFVLQTDDSEIISVLVPETWTDRDGATWDFGTWAGLEPFEVPQLLVTPSISAWNTGSWEESGVFIAAIPPGLAAPDVILGGAVEGCEFAGRSDYDDGTYTGVVERFENCGDTGAVVIEILAGPSDGSWLGHVEVVLAADEHPSVYEQIVQSWSIQQFAG